MHPDMIPENWTIWKNFLFSHCSHFVDALLLIQICTRYLYQPSFPSQTVKHRFNALWDLSSVYFSQWFFFCFKHIIGLVSNTFVLIFDVKIGPGFKNTPQCTLLKSC